MVTTQANVYVMDLYLPNEVILKDVIVISAAIETQVLGVIIGMDVISMGDFAVGCKDGVTQFSFRIPSNVLPDFTQDGK